VGSLVTIKGVTIGDKLEGSNCYYYFDYNGLQSYVRIYKANCPLTPQQQEELKMSHALHYGWSANVTGVVYSYNGVAHLLPVDLGAFEYISEPNLPDVDKVNIEINNIILEQVVFEQNATIALPFFLIGGFALCVVSFFLSNPISKKNNLVGSLLPVAGVVLFIAGLVLDCCL
jgi:hypothetical protein